MKSAPPMSSTIVGRAVPTLVSSRALRKTAIPVATIENLVVRMVFVAIGVQGGTHEIRARTPWVFWYLGKVLHALSK